MKREVHVQSPAQPTEISKPITARDITVQDLTNALNKVVGNQLRPVLTGLALLYCFYALNQYYILDAKNLKVTFTSIGILFGLRLLLAIVNIPPRLSHPLALFTAGLVLTNCFLEFILFPNPIHTINLILLAVGAGCFFLSVPYLTLVILAICIGWIYFVATSDTPKEWLHYGFGLFTSFVLSLYVHGVRLITYRKQEYLNLTDQSSESAIHEASVDAKDSEERFRRLSSASFEGIAVHKKSVIVDANDTLANMFGYEPAELLGKNILTLFSEESQRYISESALLGDFKNIEARALHKSGGEFDVEIFARNLPDKDESLMVMVIRDITERKSAEMALAFEKAKLENQFRRQTALANLEMTVDQTNELFSVLGSITETVTLHLPASGGACIILWETTTEEFLVGATTIEEQAPLSVVPSELCGQGTGIRWVFEGRESLVVPNIKDDSMGIRQLFPGIGVQACAMIPLVSEERVLGVFVVLDKQSRTLKPEDMDFLNALASRAAIIVAKVQLYEKIRNANQLLEQQSAVLMRSNEELAQAKEAAENARMNLEQQHIELENKNKELAYAHQVTEQARAVLEQQRTELETKNIELSKAKEITESAMSVLEHQQAELEKKNIELARAKEAADAASKAKTEFLANISHELRTPMNGILGMSNLLATSELSADQKDYLDTLNHSAEKLLTIINDILDFTKMDSGQLSLENNPFELENVVDEVVNSFTPAFHKNQIDFLCSLPPEIPIFLSGDSKHLQQILRNLLDNAIKFTNQGHVQLEISKVGEDSSSMTLFFSVKDTGIGISEEMQATIFTPFQQVDNSDTRNYGGVGLGLAICKNLINLMHGKMGLESTVGSGSNFWFELSFQKQPDMGQHGMPVTYLGMQALIVADNTLRRSHLEDELTKYQVGVKSTTSPDEALSLMRQKILAGEPYKLVIISGALENSAGAMLAAKIKSNSVLKSTKLVLLDCPNSTITETKEFVTVLSRPIMPRKLRECLNLIASE